MLELDSNGFIVYAEDIVLLLDPLLGELKFSDYCVLINVRIEGLHKD